MIITEKQLEALEKHIPNIRELAKSDDVNTILIAIDEITVDNILANGGTLDDEGSKIQLIYDQIYNQNE